MRAFDADTAAAGTLCYGAELQKSVDVCLRVKETILVNDLCAAAETHGGKTIVLCHHEIAFLQKTVKIGSATTKMVTLITPVLTIVLVFLLVMLIKHTKIGMAMRAVSRDFETSSLIGIDINRVITVTFVIGCGLAAIGSILYFSNYTGINPMSGAMPGLKAFVAAVFGGIGSVPGAVVGAFVIGVCENLIKGAGWTTFSDAFTFVLLIVILMVKPTGLFGEKNIDKV